MSQAPEIPGYYYDREKKKYFKIQANAPSSSAYSSQNVKKRKNDDETERLYHLKAQRKSGRITRARILEVPIAGGFLSREFGHPCLDTVATSFYARNLNDTVNSRLLDAQTITGPRFFDAIAYESNSFICFSVAMGKWVRQVVHVEDRPQSVFTFDGEHEDYIGGDQAQPSSVCANESIGHFVTTWSGVSPQKGVLINRPEFSSLDAMARDSSPQPTILLGPGRLADILSSTPAPPNSEDAFAIGASNGILRINKRFDMSWIRTGDMVAPYHSDRPKDIFALQYLPNHKDILLTGARRGILSVMDLREPQSGPTAAKIQHTSAIVHIKSLDEHRVLVAGCASDLSQYDRRFTKPWTSQFTKALTPPYLTYPEYRNNGLIHTGLDIDLELGIVAAAEPSTGIKLFSLHGGHVLKNIRLQGKGHNSRRHFNTTCIKFIQDTPHRPKSLWAALSDSHEMFKLSTDTEDTDTTRRH